MNMKQILKNERMVAVHVVTAMLFLHILTGCSNKTSRVELEVVVSGMPASEDSRKDYTDSLVKLVSAWNFGTDKKTVVPSTIIIRRSDTLSLAYALPDFRNATDRFFNMKPGKPRQSKGVEEFFGDPKNKFAAIVPPSSPTVAPPDWGDVLRAPDSANMNLEDLERFLGSSKAVFKAVLGKSQGNSIAGIDYYNDVESVHKAIGERLAKLEEQSTKDEPVRIVVVVLSTANESSLSLAIVRSGKRVGSVSLEILVPQLDESTGKSAQDMISNLRKISESGASVPNLDAGIRREDALDARVSIGAGDFWTSSRLHDLLTRNKRSSAGSDDTIERLIDTLGDGALAIGYSLPPDDPQQAARVPDHVVRLFGSHRVDFARDFESVCSEVAKALANKRSVVVIMRNPPSSSLDRVIVPHPIVLKEKPRFDAPAVHDAKGEVAAKWYEVLYIWDRKTGTGKDGNPEDYYLVADQEAGSTSGDSGAARKGWVPMSAVVPWKTELVMRFTHPGGRNRCLFFDSSSRLQNFLGKPDAERKSRLQNLIERSSTASGGFPEGIVSIEPDAGVDWREGLYILPILSFQKQANNGTVPSTIFQTVCLTRHQDATTKRALASATQPTDLDIVIVMDLTLSMGKWVAPTHNALLRLTRGVLARAGANADHLRFGAWGYRDGYWDTVDEKGQPLREGSPRDIPGIGFVTHNYTATLQDGATFPGTVASLTETKVDSIDVAEDVLAGLADAIQKTAWRDGAGRIILLIGDAPGREPDQIDQAFLESHPYYRDKIGTLLPKGTRSGMDTEGIRQLATENHVFIASIFLREPGQEKWWKWGENQFQALATNPGGNVSFAWVEAGSLQKYNAIMDGLAEALGSKAMHVAPTTADLAGAQTNTPEYALGAEIAGGLFDAVVRDSLRTGCDATIEGWTLDHDLGNWDQKPVEPCVLVSRSDLNSLYETLKAHVYHLKSKRVSPDEFLDGLKLVSAWLQTKFQGTISETDFGVAQGDIAYLRTILPYESLALQVTQVEWNAMSSDERNKFVGGLEAHLRFYEYIEEDSTLWKPLREGQDDQDYVALIPLSRLP